jgi:hypothetical protein
MSRSKRCLSKIGFAVVGSLPKKHFCAPGGQQTATYALGSLQWRPAGILWHPNWSKTSELHKGLRHRKLLRRL